MEATAPLAILLSFTFAETKAEDYFLFMAIDEQLLTHHPSFFKEPIILPQAPLVFLVKVPVF